MIEIKTCGECAGVLQFERIDERREPKYVYVCSSCGSKVRLSERFPRAPQADDELAD